MLDQPTNYLDRESLGAKAAAIKIHKGALLITHNSEFSETVCPGDGKLHITGAGWMEAAEKARAAAAKTAELLKSFDAHMEEKLGAFGSRIAEEEKL